MGVTEWSFHDPLLSKRLEEGPGVVPWPSPWCFLPSPSSKEQERHGPLHHLDGGGFRSSQPPWNAGSLRKGWLIDDGIYEMSSGFWQNNQHPGNPTTIQTIGVNVTTIAYLRVLIIGIGSTIILMVVEAQGTYNWVVYSVITYPIGSMHGILPTMSLKFW